MDMIKVESSNIDKIGWENNELIVEFKTGNKYKYKDVDKNIFYEFIGSKSRGHYLSENIKGKYYCIKL